PLSAIFQRGSFRFPGKHTSGGRSITPAAPRQDRLSSGTRARESPFPRNSDPLPDPLHMLHWILRKIVGSKNQRELRKLWPIVQQINKIELELQSQPEEVLKAKTAAWK